MVDSSCPAAGPGRVNQLGGAYINGKPLSKEIRHEILTLARQGFRPCDISRRLRITHGCISKLLSKYRKTGSIQPGGDGVGRPRRITPHIANRIEECAKERPGIYPWEIRDRLVQENICSIENIPSLNSISRLLNNYKRTTASAEGIQQPRGSNSYSIASILNLPSNSESSLSNSSSSSLISSSDSNVERISDDHGQHTGLYRNYDGVTMLTFRQPASFIYHIYNQSTLRRMYDLGL